ncbi:hypothetical protein T01_16089 [Trichinella spiralis]|uniref:Uncharacterized protein n=1 Tax=Trichinella spiralis TaxID=6334 RepID=A0A0V1BDS0_TRISP|nr:hypothetical protein T01_16089 [Trichinella spiralis]
MYVDYMHCRGQRFSVGSHHHHHTCAEEASEEYKQKKLNKQKIIKLTFVPLGQSRDAGRDEQTEHELPKPKRSVEYDSHRKRA